MKIALLTSKELINLIPEEKLLIEAFSSRGIEAIPIVWNECEDFSPYDFVLIRTAWDYIHHSDLFKKQLQKVSSQSKLVNPYETILWNMDKRYLQELSQKVNVVPTEVYDSLDENNYKEALRRYSEIVIKPLIGAAGFHTFRVSDFDPEICDKLNSVAVIIQPFMEKVITEGEYSYLFFNDRFSHCIVKRPRKGEFRVQDEHGGSYQRYLPTEGEIEEAKKYLHSHQNSSFYARVDIVKNEHGEMVLMELELIEPQLFFELGGRESAQLFVSEFLLSINNST
jgi:glutathione synthase/RimK-type ligase-like ATP-grasp enzyme